MKIYTLVLSFMFSVVSYSSVPGDSVYQLTDEWSTSLDKKIQLEDLKGTKQIVAMMYTHCINACPIIVSNMKKIEKQLKNSKEDIDFVLVSLTPMTDSVAVLHDFAQTMKLDESRWTLLSGSVQSVRSLSMALQLSYKKASDNDVSHSNSLVVLDEEGRVLFTQMGLPDGVEGFIKKLTQH